MNKSYVFIKNIISKKSIKLSHLEKEFLFRLGKSDIEIYNSNINELSKFFYVSNSTITRFAKKLGFDGFNELKFTINNLDESPTYLTQKIYTNIINDIKEFSEEQINFIHNLDNFKRIIIIGIGSSGLVANETMYKFGELGLKNLDIAKEPYSINLLSNSLNTDDLLVVLSLSGENRNILEGMNLAKKRNATILSITEDENSTLAKSSDFVLITPSYSKYEYKISKIMPILTIIDIVCEIYSKKGM